MVQLEVGSTRSVFLQLCILCTIPSGCVGCHRLLYGWSMCRPRWTDAAAYHSSCSDLCVALHRVCTCATRVCVAAHLQVQEPWGCCELPAALQRWNPSHAVCNPLQVGVTQGRMRRAMARACACGARGKL